MLRLGLRLAEPSSSESALRRGRRRRLQLRQRLRL